MDTELTNEGVCRFCLKTFSVRAIGRHLLSCKTKQQEDLRILKKKTVPKQIYHIRIWAYEPFGLHVEIDNNATLFDLDEFLKNIWLECCGHLSEFTIAGVRYSGDGEEDDWGGVPAKFMGVQLGNKLNVKDNFEYVYDFGSSTRLNGQVLHAREGAINETVRILARNNLPPFPCTICQTKATKICVECYEVYCENCILGHGCTDDLYLPVVNSPRMGVCGYDGEYDFDKFDLHLDDRIQAKNSVSI